MILDVINNAIYLKNNSIIIYNKQNNEKGLL